MKGLVTKGEIFKLVSIALLYAVANFAGDLLPLKIFGSVVALAIAAVFTFADVAVAKEQPDAKQPALANEDVDRLFFNARGDCELPPELAVRVATFLDFRALGRARQLSRNWQKLSSDVRRVGSELWSCLYRHRFGEQQHSKASQFCAAAGEGALNEAARAQ